MAAAAHPAAHPSPVDNRHMTTSDDNRAREMDFGGVNDPQVGVDNPSISHDFVGGMTRIVPSDVDVSQLPLSGLLSLSL